MAGEGREGEGRGEERGRVKSGRGGEGRRREREERGRVKSGRGGEGRRRERGGGRQGALYTCTYLQYVHVCTYSVHTHQCACAVQEVSLRVAAVKTLFHEPSCVPLVQLGSPGVVLHSQCTLTQLWESVEEGQGEGWGGEGEGEGEEMGSGWRSEEET